MERIFRNMKGERVDLIPYVFEFIQKHKGTKIFVGTDSQVRRFNIKYAIVVAFRYGTTTTYLDNGDEREIGKGCHLIYSAWEIPKRGAGKGQALIVKRLLDEITASIDTAEQLTGHSIHVEQIDFDVNDGKKANGDRWKSHPLVSTAVGWATGLGYKVSVKPEIQVATKAANHIVNN